MASVDTAYVGKFGGQYPVRVCEAEIVATEEESGGSTYGGSFVSSTKFRGTVEKVEVLPGSALKESSTVKGFDVVTTFEGSDRDFFLSYTTPSVPAAFFAYPLVGASDNTGQAVSDVYTKHVVNGNLQVDLEAADKNDSVVVRIYVRG